MAVWLSIPGLENTTSVGPEVLAICMAGGYAGEYILRRIGLTCLSKDGPSERISQIIRTGRKKRRRNADARSKRQLVFYITQVARGYQGRIFGSVKQLKATTDRRSPSLVCSAPRPSRRPTTRIKKRSLKRHVILDIMFFEQRAPCRRQSS